VLDRLLLLRRGIGDQRLEALIVLLIAFDELETGERERVVLFLEAAIAFQEVGLDAPGARAVLRLRFTRPARDPRRLDERRFLRRRRGPRGGGGGLRRGDRVLGLAL